MRYPAAMRLSDCHAIADFRRLAKRRLPWPVFDYIDGGADDEATLARNTAAFASADLVPKVLAGVAEIDTSVTILGRRSALPLILSPTALQRVFHWQGERAVARAAEKFGLWCGISSLATVSIEEIGALISSPKLFQLYVHKDKGLNAALFQRAQDRVRRLRPDRHGGGGVEINAWARGMGEGGAHGDQAASIRVSAPTFRRPFSTSSSVMRAR